MNHPVESAREDGSISSTTSDEGFNEFLRFLKTTSPSPLPAQHQSQPNPVENRDLTVTDTSTEPADNATLTPASSSLASSLPQSLPDGPVVLLAGDMSTAPSFGSSNPPKEEGEEDDSTSSSFYIGPGEFGFGTAMSVHESDISESEDDDDEDVKDEVMEETVSEEEEGPSVSSSNDEKAANNALAKERDEACSIRSIASTGSNDTAYAEFLRFLLSPTLTVSVKDDASGSVVVVKDDASSKSLVLSVKSDAGYMEFLLFLRSPSLIEKGDGAEKVLDDKPLEVQDVKDVAVSEAAAIGDVALRTSSVEKGEVRVEEGASVRFIAHLNEAMIVVASMDPSFEKMEAEDAIAEDLNEAATENVELDDVNACADKEMPHSQETPLGADTDEVVRKASDAAKAMEESAAEEPLQEAGSSEHSPPIPGRILMAAAAVSGAIARSRSPDEPTEVTATDNAFTKSSTVVELKTANSEAPPSNAETVLVAAAISRAVASSYNPDNPAKELAATDNAFTKSSTVVELKTANSSAEAVLVAATINGAVASSQSIAKPAKEAATDGICMRSPTVAETVETAYSKELSQSLRKVCVAGKSGILDKQIQTDGAATERSYTVSTPLEIADNEERSPSPEKILVAAAIGPGKQTEEVVEIDDVSAKSLTVVEPIKGTVHSGEQSPMLEKVLATAVISQTVGRSCSPEESMEEDIKFDDVSAKLSTQFEPLEETADSEDRSPSPEKVFVAAAIVWAVVRSHIAWAVTRSRSPDNEDVSVKSSATLESTLDSTGEIIVRSSTSLSLDESKAGKSCSGEVLVTEKMNITAAAVGDARLTSSGPLNITNIDGSSANTPNPEKIVVTAAAAKARRTRSISSYDSFQENDQETYTRSFVPSEEIFTKQSSTIEGVERSPSPVRPLTEAETDNGLVQSPISYIYFAGYDWSRESVFPSSVQPLEGDTKGGASPPLVDTNECSSDTSFKSSTMPSYPAGPGISLKPGSPAIVITADADVKSFLLRSPSPSSSLEDFFSCHSDELSVLSQKLEKALEESMRSDSPMISLEEFYDCISDIPLMRSESDLSYEESAESIIRMLLLSLVFRIFQFKMESGVAELAMWGHLCLRFMRNFSKSK